MAQWENVIGYPEMPGGYMLSRELGFATTSVIVDYEDPRETLLDVIKPIMGGTSLISQENAKQII